VGVVSESPHVGFVVDDGLIRIIIQLARGHPLVIQLIVLIPLLAAILMVEIVDVGLTLPAQQILVLSF